MYVVYEKNNFVVRNLVKEKENEAVRYLDYLNSLVSKLKTKYNLSSLEVEKINNIIGDLLLSIGQEITIDILSNSKIKKILKVEKKYSNRIIFSKLYVLKSKRLLDDTLLCKDGLKENLFKKAVKEIKKYSIYTEKQIEKALLKLYDELDGMEDPYRDWHHDYLSLNDGKNVNEVLNYCDPIYCVGIVIKSLRILKDEELETEMGW